jgi:hypothetical protein
VSWRRERGQPLTTSVTRRCFLRGEYILRKNSPTQQPFYRQYIPGRHEIILLYHTSQKRKGNQAIRMHESSTEGIHGARTSPGEDLD